MTTAKILHDLWLQKKFWTKEGTGDEARWVLRGLNMAIAAVHRVAEEERTKRRRGPCISRWFARDLYTAARSAYRALESGNGRTRAMTILANAMQQVEKSNGAQGVRNGQLNATANYRANS